MTQRMDDFEKELTFLINRYGMENNSNTPDFIIAKYLRQCLELYNNTTQSRELWYGKYLRPGESSDK